jgi:hypothetical protein
MFWCRVSLYIKIIKYMPNSVAFLTKFSCRRIVTYWCNGKASKSTNERYLESLISKDSCDSTKQAHEIKQTIHVLRLTKLYNILLLYCYWLLVSASIDHHQASIYRKLKNSGTYSTKTSVVWHPIYIH